MIIDCHGHFTTVPKSFRDWRTKHPQNHRGVALISVGTAVALFNVRPQTTPPATTSGNKRQF